MSCPPRGGWGPPLTPPPAEVAPQSLQELQQHKSYVKLLKQQRRELKELHKKHLKRLLALHKRLAGSSSKEAAGELLQLRQEQHRAERGCSREHLRQAQQRLREVALEAQAAQLKRLRQISEREKKELQKILDRKRHHSITEARGRRGGELTEINRRHINESVTSIRRLEEAQQRRQEKLLEGHRGVLEQIQEEEPRLAQELERGRALELPQELGRLLLDGARTAEPPPPGDTTLL